MYKTTFFIISLLLASHTQAFVTTINMRYRSALYSTATPESSTTSTTTPDLDDLVRAVDCAEHFGKCTVDDLHALADQVEQAASGSTDECLYESADDADLCDKEAADRVDVAELLRLQAELRLGMEYLEKANLFKEDVMAEHDMRQRDLEMEILSEDGI